MSNWSEKHIKDLKAAGKIKGFVPSHTKKRENYSQESGNNIPKNIPAPKPKAIVWLEWNLQYWCNERAVTLEREYKFSPDRKYRSDFAIPALKILIEYEGGIFMPRGGHNSHTGIQRDIDKYALAQRLGFTVIRLTAKNYKTVLQQLNEIVK